MKVAVHVALVCLFASSAFAQQPPEITKEHKRLHKDVGNWTGTMKIYTGEPNADPMVLPVKETGKLFGGGLWVLTDFDAGPFQGHGQFGYDIHKQKYVGTWIDNTNPAMSVMEGEFDESKNEMVMAFSGTDPATGKTVEMKSVSTTDGDDKRNFVMLNKKEGEWEKAFEINYQREK